jgi:archaellum biogenesis protein FlaJ (TadC family)
MQEYGLTLWEKIRFFQEWAPVASYVQSFLATSDPHRQAIIVADACEWLASKTHTRLDDEFVNRLAAVLRSREGEELLRWVVSAVQGK